MMARLLCLAGLLLAAGTCAAVDAEPATVAPLQEPLKRSAKAPKPIPTAYLFAKQVILRGTLGDEKIQVRLGPKEDIMEGIEGDYFVFGMPHKILLAGDLGRGILVMEESQDGRKVSGRWEGTQDGNTLSGTWTSMDDKVTKPFVLTVINDKPRVQRVGTPRPKPEAVPPAAQ